MKVSGSSELPLGVNPAATAPDFARSDSVKKSSHGLINYFGFLLVCLAVLVMQSRWEWTYKPQYYYGWGVPLLSFYLFLKRWTDRPSAESLPRYNVFFWTALGAMLVVWFPLRVLREANMDWRLLHWLVGGGVVLLMLAGTWFLGGKPWLKHFAFPILFLLVAITWPSDIEGRFVHRMSRILVLIATEFLNILGWPAWSAGNIIYLPNASVGMEDACSGIRSFQTSLMIAFFLGELSRLSLSARGLLILSGLVLAFLLNLVRTLTLTFITARMGSAAAEKWHDQLGFAILTLSFLGLYGICHLLRRRFPETPVKASISHGQPAIFPRTALVVVASWLLLVEVVTEVWYRRNDPATPFTWAQLQFSKMPEVKVEPLTERVQGTLVCTSAESASWKDQDASEWWVFVINWARGASGNVSASTHSPEICLPNAGLKLIEKQEPFLFTRSGATLAHEVYLFHQGKRPMYVFFARRMENKAPDTMTMQDRFGRAWNGQRLLASQVVEVAIAGVSSRELAEQKYSRFLTDNLVYQ
ncbi:MAG: exosortase/archaeosortase family protein [Verrucomicrobiales bacterium]